jgi:glycosyltransferase involved in cell wall biosynthesis
MKILITTTISDTVIAFLIPHIEQLVCAGYTVDVAFSIKHKLPEKLVKLVRNVYNLPFQRNPFHYRNLIAFKAINKIISNNKYDFVHTHTPTAGVLTRLACKFNNTKTIYTAHGFHFFKGAPLLNWLIYFPVEWLLSFFTDCLITINQEDYAFAKKYLHAKKVEYIPGVGIDLDKFKYPRRSRTVMRKELQIPEKATVLLSVGELNKNKNHETALKAFAKINDNSLFYVICGHGPLAEHLRNLVHRLKVSDRVLFLGYRSDIVDIMKASDIYIHPSFREGLPVSLMEAMACGLPCLASKIRGNTDLIKGPGKNYLFAPNDVDALSKAIKGLSEDSAEQKLLREDNLKNILEYRLINILNKTAEFYLS